MDVMLMRMRHGAPMNAIETQTKFRHFRSSASFSFVHILHRLWTFQCIFVNCLSSVAPTKWSSFVSFPMVCIQGLFFFLLSKKKVTTKISEKGERIASDKIAKSRVRISKAFSHGRMHSWWAMHEIILHRGFLHFAVAQTFSTSMPAPSNLISVSRLQCGWMRKWEFRV